MQTNTDEAVAVAGNVLMSFFIVARNEGEIFFSFYKADRTYFINEEILVYH